MTKKEKFIEIVQYIVFEDEDNYAELFSNEDWNIAREFFEDLKNGKVKNSGGMTENGKKILLWMQENCEKMTNIFTSKEIAEGLFTSGRSVAGGMRKLISDGYVEKIGQNPVQYALTESGKLYQFDN